MASTDKSAPVPYQPANPPSGPEDLARSTWDELYRIAERFISVDTPAALSAVGNDTVPITTTDNYSRLFDGTNDFQWEQPPDQLNVTTGQWTCPQEGLFNLQIIVEIPEFPVPGLKFYVATLRSTFIYADGRPSTLAYSKMSGTDESPLRLVALFLNTMVKGDIVQWDLDLTQDQTNDQVVVLSILNVFRVSTTR